MGDDAGDPDPLRSGLTMRVPPPVGGFASILLMGIPMYTLNRGLWLVTVATTTALLITMTLAIRQGTA